jgi:hypothetical protein
MQVFISFSSADRKIAEKIYDRLKKGGIDCWICTQDIPPGADYQACIVEAITASEVVVLVFSSKANLSPEIAKELSLASKKILIPARIEDVVPQGSFQYQLSNRQFVDLFDDFDNKLDELVERIQSVLAGAGAGGAATAPTRHRRRGNLHLKLAGGAVALALLAAGGWALKGKLAGPEGERASTMAQSTSPPVARTAAILATPAQARVAPAPAAEAARTPLPAPAAVAPAVPAPTLAQPAAGPSQVASFLPLLGNTQSHDRANAIRALLDRMPMNLSTADANLVLQGLGGQRAAGLAAIAPHLADPLDGNDVAQLLNPMTTYDRVNSIHMLVGSGKVKEGLSAQEAKIILEGTQGQRAAGINMLASHLAPQLSGKDAAIVLGELTTYDRVNILRLLASTNKLTRSLQPEEARLLLEGSGGQRSGGIRALAPNMAEGMDGKSLAMILGETMTHDRLNSLRTLSDARRIGKLQSAELELILQNMDSQRASALQLMAQYLAR